MSSIINNNTKKSGPAPQLHVVNFMHSSSWDPAVGSQLGLVNPDVVRGPVNMLQDIGQICRF